MSKFKPKFWSKPQLKEVKESKPRTVEEIRQEYGAMCAQIGERQFRIEAMKAEMNGMYSKIQELNEEHMKAQKEAADKAAEEAKAGAAESKP